MIVVIPTGYGPAGVAVAVKPVETLSVTVAVPGFTVVAGAVASTSTFAGAVTTGAVWSVTVTVAVAVPMLAYASVEKNVTIVVPSGNCVYGSCVTLKFAPRLSAAVAPVKKAAI